jgi:polyisoprenoid-binding protein YceI
MTVGGRRVRIGWMLLGLGAVLGSMAIAQDDGSPGEPELVEEAPEPASTRSYTLDVSDSWIYVVIYNDDGRWTPVTGHDHGIRATSFTGSVSWNAEDAGACKVDIRVPYIGLRVDPPGMRERLGFSANGAISDNQKTKVVGNMLGKGQLDKANFGEVRFVSDHCSGTTGTVDVTGIMTMRGVAKRLTIPMNVSQEGDLFRASGTLTLGHADFGMKPFTYGPGTPKNQEKLTFGVDVVGKAN